MEKNEMIRELRALTQAGITDCKEAVEHCQGDLQKAVDYIKVKGLNIADGRSGRAASEGVCAILMDDSQQDEGKCGVMVEVNCQTDFVAKNHDFAGFADQVAQVILDKTLNNESFTVADVDVARRQLVSTTKENIVVRRWWVEQAFDPNAKVFCYMHSNQKIGVLLTLLADRPMMINAPEMQELGDNLCMQVCAMNPIAVSSDRITGEDKARQDAIFQEQLQKLNKPAVAWAKILEGKTRKWHTEVCLLEQESVWVAKTTVAQAIKDVAAVLGGEIKVVNFIRCQVGEGIETKKDNLAEEVAKLSGVHVCGDGQCGINGNENCPKAMMFATGNNTK